MDYYEAFRGPRVAATGMSGIERFWMRMVHLSVPLVFIFGHVGVGPTVGPLLIMLTMGERSRDVDEEAVEALNFAITASLLWWIPTAITTIATGFFTGVFAGAIRFVILIFVVCLALRARHQTGLIGRRYPLTIRFVHPVWTSPGTQIAVRDQMQQPHRDSWNDGWRTDGG